MPRVIARRVKQLPKGLLTRSGLHWTDKYSATASFLAELPCEGAYIDGELCTLDEKSITSFAAMQSASGSGASQGLVAFDLLHLSGILESFETRALHRSEAKISKGS
jgi:ATP-dependent DNA ligase